MDQQAVRFNQELPTMDTNCHEYNKGNRDSERQDG